jgi:cysteine-rich repeat protein
VCGDGVLHAGEQCDLGDVVDADGCDQDCRFELLIPGGATGTGDCLAEWAVINPLNEPPFDDDGLPNTHQTCTDGDPSCDADGLVNDECRFRVALCFDVPDPNLPDCAVDVPIAKYVLEVPRPNSTDPTRAANGTAMLAAFTRLSDVAPRGGNENTLVFEPPLDLASPNNCTATAEIVVPLLDGATSSDERLRGEVSGAPPAGETTGPADRDSLLLICVRP